MSSQSGKVRLNGGLVQGSVSERRVDGTIGGGGLLRAESRSGSIDSSRSTHAAVAGSEEAAGFGATA